jgi:tetratricopeptide (TPR) repeat protein
VGEGSASAEWRRAADRTRRERERAHQRAPEEARRDDVWVREDDVRPPPRPRPRTRDRDLPDDVVAELSRATSGRPNRLTRDLTSAASAFESGRYQEASRYLKPLAERAPTAAAVRELLGLTLYRMGRWRPAIVELEAFRQLTGSLEHEPVVADCERALGHHDAVERRWDELRRASPSAEVLGEGRLVMAGSLADRGELERAIALLSRYEPDRARPRPWHVRTWYALADLYERAGDVPRARGLFQRLVRMDAEWFDAAERLAALQ